MVPWLLLNVSLAFSLLLPALDSSAGDLTLVIEPLEEVTTASALPSTEERPLEAPLLETLTATNLSVAPEPDSSGITRSPSPEPMPAPAPAPAPDNPGVLNSVRQFALGMIETGNDDGAIGGLGEVSRFQIMPSVWKQYSTSRNYRNLDDSTEVARQHWVSLHDYFKKKTDREPTDFDMYVLWNTRYGYYASKGFTPHRLSAVVRDRAQRYANLVEDGYRNPSLLEMASAR